MLKNPVHINDACPLQKLTAIVSDAWTILIIRDTLISPKRFCELEKSLTGISTRTLTLKLHKLIKDGILDHKELYYTPTRKGHLLKSVIDEMTKVGERI